MHTIIRTVCGAVVAAIVMFGLAGGACGQEKTAAATQQYEAAAALQNRGAFQQAAKEWVTFIDTYKTDPRCDRAFHYLGVCYLKADKFELARQCFEIVVKTFPDFELLEAAYLDLGVAQYNLGQSGKVEMYDAATAAFDTLLAKFPAGKHTAEALFYRGECLYHRGKKAEAAESYAQLAAKFPDDKLAIDALYALGVSREELGEQAEAGKTFDLFLEKYPQSPLAAEVAMRRGDVLFALGQFEPAIERFAAAAVKPGFALADHATFRQAAALAELKRYAEAAALYASVSLKWPQSKLAGLANLAGGKCYYLAGDFAQARTLLGQVISGGGKSAADAAHWLARSLLKEGKPAEAIAALEKARPQTGQSAATTQWMMDQADAVYDIPERRGESAALYAAVAAKQPDDPLAPQALYMAGFAALGQGDFATALKHATTLLRTYPDSSRIAEATYVAAESRLQLGQLAEAEKLFAELVKKYPSRADAETWKVRYGLTLYMQKKYAETAAVVQPVLPGLHAADVLAEANYLVGGSQLELHQPAAAAKSLEASLAAQPKWRQADEVLLLLAQAYDELKDSPKAVATIERLIAELSNSRLLDRAHYRLAEDAYASGDFVSAAGEYQQVLDKWPQSALAPSALYGLGWVKLSQNDPAAAEKLFGELLQKYPDHTLIPRARYARGMARHQRKDFAGAIDDIQVFLAADPAPAEKSDARYLLGLCQAGLQKQEEAAATFETLLQDDPKYAGADKVLYELAWALKQQGKEKESAETFARLASQRRDSPLAAEAQFHAGEFAYRSGDFQAAAAACHAAWQQAGQSELGEKAAFLEGESLFEQKKFAEALAAYEKLKDAAGKEFGEPAVLHATQAAGQAGQWEKCLELSAKFIERFADSPDLPEALCEQGWAKQNLGKLDEATALYEKVLLKTEAEAAARAQFLIGEVQFQQKQFAKAVKSFSIVIDGYSYPRWQAEAAFEAGRCFEAMGKKEQAVKQYQELIAKYPESEKALLAKRRLEDIRKQDAR